MQDEEQHPVIAWLHETEGFSLRMERVRDDIERDPRTVIEWLKAAYDLGVSAVRKQQD